MLYHHRRQAAYGQRRIDFCHIRVVERRLRRHPDPAHIH